MLNIFAPKTHDIEEFLSGIGKDYKGRTFASILAYTNHQLECNHDYIQCIFPTDTPSMYVSVPIVSIEDAIKMRGNTAIQINLHLATKRMIKFYSESKTWNNKNNHNFKRISRILRSLRLFGCDNDADLFYEFVMSQDLQNVNEKTMFYWKKNNEKVPYEVKESKNTINS